MVPLLCFGLAAAPNYGQHEGDNDDESDYYMVVLVMKMTALAALVNTMIETILVLLIFFNGFDDLYIYIGELILIVDVEAVSMMMHLFAKVMIIFAIIRRYLQR